MATAHRYERLNVICSAVTLIFSKRESASPIRCAVSKLGKVGAWLWRESPQLEKLSHDCEGCLQTVHKLPVNTQEIWKISQPTPFLCFPREDHYARQADCAEACCRVGNFLHCDQVFSFGSGELGDWKLLTEKKCALLPESLSREMISWYIVISL